MKANLCYCLNSFVRDCRSPQFNLVNYNSLCKLDTHDTLIKVIIIQGHPTNLFLTLSVPQRNLAGWQKYRCFDELAGKFCY